MLPANATAAWPVESTRGVAQHAWISPPSASGSGLREPAHRPAATSGRKIRRFSGCFETAKRQWSVWRAKACAALLRRWEPVRVKITRQNNMLDGLYRQNTVLPSLMRISAARPRRSG